MIVRKIADLHLTEVDKRRIAAWAAELSSKKMPIGDELSRIRENVPELLFEIEPVSRRFLRLAEKLVCIPERRSGHKCQPFTPKEVYEMLDKMHVDLKEWHALVSRVDVCEAITQANQRIQKQRRAVTQPLGKDQEMEVILTSKLLGHIVGGYVPRIVESAVDQIELVRLAFPGNPFGQEDALPILKRLLLLDFVRSTYKSWPDRRTALATFLSSHPKPTMILVSHYAVYLLVSDILNSSELGRLLHDERVLVQAVFPCLQLVMAVRRWDEQMVTPQTLDQGYFTILGHDYSLQAQPE